MIGKSVEHYLKKVTCVNLAYLISQRETDIIWFHSYVELRNLTEDHGGREGEKVVSNREGGKP